MSFHTCTSTSIFKDEEHLGQRERMSIILMSIAKLPSSHTYEWWFFKTFDNFQSDSQGFFEVWV